MGDGTPGASLNRNGDSSAVEERLIRLCAAGSLLAVLGGLPGPRPLLAQVRGVYPLGMTAVNSGVTPAPGWSYSNQFLYYSRDESKGPSGEVSPPDSRRFSWT